MNNSQTIDPLIDNFNNYLPNIPNNFRGGISGAVGFDAW
jgi:hypothetical protein